MGRLDGDGRRLAVAALAIVAVIEGAVLADELRLGPDAVRRIRVIEAREAGMREFWRGAYLRGMAMGENYLTPDEVDAFAGVPRPLGHRWIHRDMAYRGAGVALAGIAAGLLLRRREPGPVGGV